MANAVAAGAYSAGAIMDVKRVPETLLIGSRRSPQWHVALGTALAPLRDRNILLIGSGSITHNLRTFLAERPAIDARLIAGDTGTVIELTAFPPDILRNHPRPYPAAARGEGCRRARHGCLRVRLIRPAVAWVRHVAC